MRHFKFTVITPCYNAGKYISEAIESVIYQEGNFEIEYIIVDGESNDNTINILNNYKHDLQRQKLPIKCRSVDFKIIIEKDSGIYDAVVKGLRSASSDVISYLNSDDFYQKKCFHTIDSIFAKYPKINWITGISTIYNKDGIIFRADVPFFYDNKFIQKGLYDNRKLPFLQQESTFFRKELISTLDLDRLKKFKYAGDYFIWFSFAKNYALHVVSAILSGFRRHENNTSLDIDRYYEEMFSFIDETELNEYEEQLIAYYKKEWNNPSQKWALNKRFIWWDASENSWRGNLSYDIDYRPTIPDGDMEKSTIGKRTFLKKLLHATRKSS
jgi:glycosyltransferase involved in cell wall biosynthesis